MLIALKYRITSYILIRLRTEQNTIRIDTGEKDSIVVRHKGYMDISNVLAARDPRLAQQVDADLRFVGCGRIRYEGMAGQDGAAENTSSTGYGVLKFDEPATPAKFRQATNGNETDGPIFWLGLILINHAEACAELGLAPIPSGQISLNPNLGQNPGW